MSLTALPIANIPSDCEPFPSVVTVEEISVTGFPNPKSLFERVVQESLLPVQRVVHYLNIHVANCAWQNHNLKRILQASNLVYCDGAGIVLGAKLMGDYLPTRLTAADWFLDMLTYFAQAGRSVYLLGGEPGIPEQAMAVISQKVPQHSVVGHHHGFILKDKALEQSVIDEINRLQPDILIVGFGTPLQEEWIEKNRDRLSQISVIYALGAVMDYFAGKVSRCPEWMGKAGLEWLYRLLVEPSRLMGRYVLGNPWFLSRILFKVAKRRLLGASSMNMPEVDV